MTRPHRRFPTGITGRITPKSQAGFSLLEITMAMAVLVMLAAGIFAITVSTFQLSAELKDLQDRKSTKRRLVEILEANFEALPAATKFKLETTQEGSSYVSTLSLDQAPHAFRRSQHTQGAIQTVVIRSARGRGGFVRVTLHHLDKDNARQFTQGDSGVLDGQAFVVLADRLRKFQFEFFNSQTEQWVTRWDSATRRPGLIALAIAHEGETEDSRHVFWIPPRIQ